MKTLFTYLFMAIVSLSTVQAQNISLTNGDCSTDGALTGSTPFVIPGFTIAQTTAAVNTTTSGITGGKLKISGTNGTSNSHFTITTDKVDISSYAADAIFTFNCNFTCGTATSTAQPYNVTIIAYDANGGVISSGTTSTVLTLTKIQENSNTVAGTVINCGAVAVMNNALGNCKYLAFQVQVGKMLSNNLVFDDFTLFQGKVPTFNVVPSTNLALTTEAGVASNESSFSVDGSALTSTVLIYGGSAIEMSTSSGSGFSQDTLKLTPASDGSLAATTIYARIKAAVTSVPTASTAMGNTTVKASVTHKGSGTKTVQFVGTLTGFATTIPTIDTLTATPSLALFKSVKITANSLTSNLEVTAGSNLEIATDSLFATPQTNIVLPSVGDTVYVRLKKGLPVGIVNDGTTKLTITSSPFVTKTVQFVGNSVAETAVEKVDKSTIKYVITNGKLEVRGVEEGTKIEIYNSLGNQILAIDGAGSNTVSLPRKGVYILKVGSFTQKIVVK